MNNNTDPLVSVIICFLNEENSLKAIMSVISQDYQNWNLF
jgi:glycosyltransferase involved in cell wall biosynthesis